MSLGSGDDTRSLVGRLYDTYGASLYRYAVLLLADAVMAEDVVQEVFVTILRRPPDFKVEAHYLRRAVRNACYSHYRRRRRRRESVAFDRIIEPLAPDVGPDEHIALEQAIRDLAPEQREVIYLHVFEGLTFQEIANALETSINTVAARYRYSLVKLRRTLTKS